MTVLENLRELYDYRELLWMWTLRSIKARYKQSLLGLAWAIFQPLSLTIAYVLVFSHVMRFPSDGIPYPIFAYSAVLPWSFFARSVSSGIPSVVHNMNLVTKIYFPRAVFPLSAIAASFVDFLSGVGVFIGLMVYYRVPINPAMGLLPMLFLIQLLLTAGVSLGASALNVFYRDINNMIPLLLQLWMYACPIIYPVSLVPAWLQSWYMLNPMAGIVHSYRQIILKAQLPDWPTVGMAGVISLLIFAGGYLIFRKLEDSFADII